MTTRVKNDQPRLRRFCVYFVYKNIYTMVGLKYFYSDN